MGPIIQSAPNFSEGRDADTLAALQDAARVPGAILADFSADAGHNRCVATLLGEPDALENAALRMAAVAVDRINLTLHSGEHPRVGALDVLPFIPVRNASMDDAILLARRTARRMADELQVPVYLYGEATSPPRSLPDLRKGGLDALATRMSANPPDFGPTTPHPTAGVSIVGARPPLLAFNVNLDSSDINVAKRIAARLRESGGGLPGVRALGLLVGGTAQVSVNVTDTTHVTLATVHSNILRLAAHEGVKVLGSELIGGITLDQTLQALNEALGAGMSTRQVLDSWLPPAHH